MSATRKGMLSAVINRKVLAADSPNARPAITIATKGEIAPPEMSACQKGGGSFRAVLLAR